MEPQENDELPEPDELPPVDETSSDYKAGFEAGTNLQPFDGSKSKTWQRGWADAEE